MKKLNLTFRVGRTKNIKCILANISDWGNLNARLYAVDKDGIKQMDISGVVQADTFSIVFPVTFSITSLLSPGELRHEIILYYTNRSIVKNLFEGIITIEPSILTDPIL